VPNPLLMISEPVHFALNERFGNKIFHFNRGEAFKTESFDFI